MIKNVLTILFAITLYYGRADERLNLYYTCKVNDNDSVRFLFDTGANYTAIKEKLSEKKFIIPYRKSVPLNSVYHKIKIPLFKEINLGYCGRGKFHFSDGTAKKYFFFIDKEVELNKGVDGILGWDIIRKNLGLFM